MPSELAEAPTPDDDLEEILQAAWRLLADGVTDRRAPFHTPCVATVDGGGLPSVRTVVLRAVDPAARLLRFHSDLRSMKVAALRGNPHIAVHGYDAGRKTQLRLTGAARVHADDALAEDAWRGSRPFSRACYRVSPGPGSPIVDPSGAFTPEDRGDLKQGRENFCAVVVRVDALEWLYLSAKGHRRARFDWHDGVLSASWLVP